MRIDRWFAVGAATLALAACDNNPAATPARDHKAEASSSYSSSSSYDARGGGDSYSRSADADRPDPRKQPIPQVDGKPMWSANRRNTAEENAQSHFERDGADFGAKSVDDYVKKAHTFVTDPPKDALTLKRANGDTLVYDPKANVFAVATRDGAPRTMFKPRDGMAYWEKQKDRETRQASRGGGRSDSEG